MLCRLARLILTTVLLLGLSAACFGWCGTVEYDNYYATAMDNGSGGSGAPCGTSGGSGCSSCGGGGLRIQPMDGSVAGPRYPTPSCRCYGVLEVGYRRHYTNWPDYIDKWYACYTNSSGMCYRFYTENAADWGTPTIYDTLGLGRENRFSALDVALAGFAISGAEAGVGASGTVSIQGGPTMTLLGLEVGDTGSGTYHVTTAVDQFGRTTEWEYPGGEQITSGRPESYTDYRGRETILEVDNISDPLPLRVKDPDGVVRTAYAYGDGNLITSITRGVTPNVSVTDYTYNGGKIDSATASSDVTTVVGYWATDAPPARAGKGRITRILNATAGEVYSQTLYDYDVINTADYVFPDWLNELCPTCVDPDDIGFDVGVTAIIRSRAVGSVTPLIPTSQPDPVVDDDLITIQYYYGKVVDDVWTNLALRAEQSIWYEGETKHETCTMYTYEFDESNNIGHLTEVTSPDGTVTHYDYYETDVQYAIPHDAESQDDQYYVASRSSVQYDDDGDNDVDGNGLVRQVTVDPLGPEAGGGVYTAAEYRYQLQTVSSVLKMMPYVTVTADERGKVHKRVLNDDGQATEVWEDAGGATLSFITDADGHPSRTLSYVASGTYAQRMQTETVHGIGVNGEDVVTYYQYSSETAGDRVTIRENNVSGKIISVSQYNLLDQIAWNQDSRGWKEGYETEYAYDGQGRLTTATYPPIAARTSPLIVSDTAKTMVNDYSCCHLNWTQDERGNKTYYEYDGAGRVVKQWTDIGTQSEDYPLTEYVYDDANFGVLQEAKTRSAQGVERTTSYEYDARGQLTKTIYPYDSTPGDLLGSEEFIYDDLGRLVLSKDGEGSITAYKYDDHGRVSCMDYDYSGSFALPIDEDEFDENVTYNYDGHSGLVSEVSGTINGVSVGATYAYDPQGRITSYTPGVPAGYGSITYAWNNLDQKTSMTVPLGLNVSNNARRIEYKYDRDGKMVGMDVIACTVSSSGTTLEAATASSTQFFHDDNQNRVKMVTTDNATFDGTYYFVYDPTASIPAVVYEQGPTYRYLNVREPDGSLVSRQRYVGANGNALGEMWYHFDALGSTVALSDEDGVTTDRYSYDAWGIATHTGAMEDNPYQYVGQLGYYTHYQEPSFGLLQLGVRYYDPALGRFTSRDPAEDGWNYYAYVENDPLDKVDPSGLQGYGVGGNNGNWWENINTFCDIGLSRGVALCLQEAGRQAMNEVIAKYGTMVDRTESNAMLHCTMACKMAAHCGRDNACACSNNHEEYNWDPQRGSMDLWNNRIGLHCADTGLSGEGSCLACCDKMRRLGHLRWFVFPPRHAPPIRNKPFPIYPEFPGGCE